MTTILADHTADRQGDRPVAWSGAILAAGVSIAVNVGHAAPVSWGFVAFSACLPLFIVIGAELMVRRLLPAWIVAVIGVAAYALSFWHTVLLLIAWHEPQALAVAGSVAVDGLMVGSTVALYRLRRSTAPAEPVVPVSERVADHPSRDAFVPAVMAAMTQHPQGYERTEPTRASRDRFAPAVADALAIRRAAKDDPVTAALVERKVTPPLTQDRAEALARELSVSVPTIRRRLRAIVASQEASA